MWNLQDRIQVRMGNSLSPEKFNLLYIRLLVKYVKRSIIRSVFSSKFKKNKSYKRLYKPRNLKEWYKFHLFNSMWELFIEGFVELTGLKIKFGTYELLTILRKLSIFIDDALDLHRVGGIEEKDLAKINMKEALKNSRVKENIDALGEFLQAHGDEYKKSVLGFLDGLFDNYENGYTDILKKNDIPFEDCLTLTEQDSGLWLYAVTQSLALFNDFSLNEKEKDILFNLGVVCKFADDLNDVCRDYNTNAPNLMMSLMQEEKDKYGDFKDKIGDKMELSRKWWVSNFPGEYKNYFIYADRYYKKVEGTKFRMLIDLSFLPSILGKDYDRKR